MDLTKLRAWWWHKQGLDGSLAGAAPSEVLRRAGWARSVGGANPYLTLFARAGTSKAAAESAVEALDIYELPSARGCTYFVPHDDFALALTAGQSFDGGLGVAKKFLGVTDEELEPLKAAVVKALEAGPKDPAELRAELGDAVRNLGDEGKKRGQTTTLPLALGLLQSTGEIRRVPIDGRLDGQRYQYVNWRPNPLAGTSLGPQHAAPLHQEEAATELAGRYFRWTSPATLAHWRWFSGLGVGAAKAAIAPLGLTDLGDGWLIPDDEVDAFQSFTPSPEPSYALVSSLDSLVLLRRDLGSLIDAPQDAGRRTDRIAGAALSSPDLENHAIFERGRLVGLWEYDPAAQQIVWASSDRSEELRAAVLRTEAFIRDLGDARSFSLDSPKSRQPRLEALREMSAT